MRKDWQEYRDTGMLGAYHPEDAVLHKNEYGNITADFEDTAHRQEQDALVRERRKELDSMRKRSGELSALFKRLYEDNVLGRVTNEQFRMLSTDYNAEQKTLEDAIPEKEARLEKLKASAANVDAFIEKAKRYTAIDELTPELLRLFIQRIEVGERSKKYSRNSTQSIRIVHRDIGAKDSPMEQEERQTEIIPATSRETAQRLPAYTGRKREHISAKGGRHSPPAPYIRVVSTCVPMDDNRMVPGFFFCHAVCSEKIRYSRVRQDQVWRSSVPVVGSPQTF